MPFLRAVVVLAAALVLAGCSATPATSAASSAPSATTPAAVATSAPTPTPVADQLVATIDGLTVVSTDGETVASAPFADGAAVVSLLNDVLGSTPTGTRDAPDAKYRFDQTYYDWRGVKATIPDGDQSRSHAAFSSAEVNGIRLSATGGIAVGMSRADAVARGAVDPDGYDGDGDGESDYLELDVRPAPGTESLTTPGAVGSDFLLIVMDGDVVAGIQSGGNDYSDL